jgi:hypothetical protein
MRIRVNVLFNKKYCNYMLIYFLLLCHLTVRSVGEIT